MCGLNTVFAVAGLPHHTEHHEAALLNNAKLCLIMK